MCEVCRTEGHAVRACAQGDNKGFLVCKKKMATSADLLCRWATFGFSAWCWNLRSLSLLADSSARRPI